jgi:hypothetical protein
MDIPPLDKVLDNINILVDEYFVIRVQEDKIFRMHEIAEELARESLYLSYHYLNQQREYAIARSNYDIQSSARKLALMDMPSYNNKKMTATFAAMTAEQESIELKKSYLLADAEREGINSITFQIKENITGIRQRIASIKNTNV